MKNQYKIANLLIVTPMDWEDITEALEGDDVPFTLAKESGVGALQISFGKYRSGKLPMITLPDIDDMRRQFAKNEGFSNAFDELASDGGLLISGGSYHAGQDFVRVWYCSNGKDVALVTYVADWKERSDESKECDDIVSKFVFEQ